MRTLLNIVNGTVGVKELSRCVCSCCSSGVELSHRHLTFALLSPTRDKPSCFFSLSLKVNVINSAVCGDWPSSAQPTFARSPLTQGTITNSYSLLYILCCSMRCVSWLLLGTSLLVLGPAVRGAPAQCPNLCHCHGDLQHVICDSVGLKKIPRVSEATRLLNLQRNSLGSIPTGAFSDSKGLVSLHMQHCQLREIGSQAFKGLTKLVYLYLSNNEIASIKPGAFEDLTELTYLYLDGNHITELAKGLFSPMINLFILQLNNNRLRELRPGTFAGAKGLRWLHMANNTLTTLLPGSLDEVENLAILHLDGNRMATYPLAAMSKLRVVEELTLGRNPMRTIPDVAFQSFGRYMERLHLDSMGLERFSDGAFTGVTAIKSLHLDNNRLRTLPKSLDYGTLTNISLSNNPWTCNCQLSALRRWMDSSRVRPDALCAAPAQQKGRQLRDSTAFSGCKVKQKRAKKGARQ